MPPGPPRNNVSFILLFKLLLTGLLGLYSAPQMASPNVNEPLIIGVHEAAFELYPEVLTKVDAIGKIAGIEFKFTSPLPPMRTLIAASTGQIDGDVFRQPHAVKDYPTLLPVKEPIIQLEFWVWMKASRSCPSSKKDLAKLVPVGILGYKVFQFAYEHTEVGYEETITVASLLKMLEANRADYTILDTPAAIALGRETNTNIRRCFDKPFIDLPGYLYLHQKHRDLIPKLEAALRQLESEGKSN